MFKFMDEVNKNNQIEEDIIEMNYVVKEETITNIHYKLIEEMVKGLEYLGVKFKMEEVNEETLRNSSFQQTIEKIISTNLYGHRLNELVEESKKVESYLLGTFGEYEVDKEEYEKTYLSKKVENYYKLSEMNEYITQAEACRILDKESGYIANMLERLGAKEIRGRVLVNKNMVEDYKELLDAKEELSQNENIMSAKEVANYLKRSEDFVYKLMNEGTLNNINGLNYASKDEVETYKEKIEDMYWTYNPMDYYTTKEVSVLIKMSKQTINNMITDGVVFEEVEFVGKTYFIPRKEVVKLLNQKGFDGDNVLESRELAFKKLMELLVETFKVFKEKKSDLALKNLKKDFEAKGMNYIYVESLKRLKRGDKVYNQ